MKKQKISIPVRMLMLSVLCLVISVIWFSYTASTASIVIMVLAFIVAVCSAGTIIFSRLAGAKGKQGKAFFYFILTDILLILVSLIYGFYDIMTDTGMLAGITGILLVYYAVPMMLGAGVLAWVIYRVRQKIQKNRDK